MSAGGAGLASIRPVIGRLASTMSTQRGRRGTGTAALARTLPGSDESSAQPVVELWDHMEEVDKADVLGICPLADNARQRLPIM